MMDTFGRRYGQKQENGVKIQETLDGQVTEK
jgi:hypothetical protein